MKGMVKESMLQSETVVDKDSSDLGQNRVRKRHEEVLRVNLKT